jgi:hypothetical protein
MVMTDKDTALMAIGTAFGGLQTPILRRVIGESQQTGSNILTSTTGLAAVAVGLTFIGIGVGARLGKIDFDNDVATVMLGYGISAILSLGINYITSTTLVATSRSARQTR